MSGSRMSGFTRNGEIDALEVKCLLCGRSIHIPARPGAPLDPIAFEVDYGDGIKIGCECGNEVDF